MLTNRVMRRSHPLLLIVTGLIVCLTAEASKLSQPFTSSFHHLKHAACVTLFTREGKQGCGTSSREVQSGRIVPYKGEGSLSKVDVPHVAVLAEVDVTKETLEDVLASNTKGYLQGILIANSSSYNNYYSPSSRSPNGKRTPSQFLNYGNSAYGWNSYGDSLLQLDFKGIPMAYVLDRDVSDELLDSNIDAKADFNYYMGPLTEINSFTCLSWKDTVDKVWRPKCLPLGGNSVWSTMSPVSASGRRRRDLHEQQNDEQTPLNGARNARALANDNSAGVFFLTASMDANSMFHDATPAANEAATNILTILLAAKLLGQSGYQGINKVVVALFQGEAFGFIGSRRFFKDIAGFSCKSTLQKSVTKNTTAELACLYPLRPSLEFTKILDNDTPNILGLLSVDQVGVLANKNTLYIHNDGSNYGAFLSNILQAVTANSFTISEVEADADDDHFDGGAVTVPPTPLTSLLSTSGGAYGGAVLSGYANNFVAKSRYGSHRNSIAYQDMNYASIATAATVLARTAVAAIADDGSLDYETASATALSAIPNALSENDETLKELGDCLLSDGNCPLLMKYARAEAAALSKKTGLSISIGSPLGTPPNFYTSVYSYTTGQPYVTVNGKVYGAYTGSDYGKHKSDTFAVQPSFLEMAVRGMLTDFLGRPQDVGLQSCKSASDCHKVDYCGSTGESICTGGHVCVCNVAHYHQALDEALEASPDNTTGYFIVQNDDGVSALYTEPYWSSSVGISVYRDDQRGSVAAIIFGSCILLGSIISSFLLKRRLTKEKLY